MTFLWQLQSSLGNKCPASYHLGKDADEGAAQTANTRSITASAWGGFPECGVWAKGRGVLGLPAHPLIPTAWVQIQALLTQGGKLSRLPSIYERFGWKHIRHWATVTTQLLWVKHSQQAEVQSHESTPPPLRGRPLSPGKGDTQVSNSNYNPLPPCEIWALGPLLGFVVLPLEMKVLGEEDLQGRSGFYKPLTF